MTLSDNIIPAEADIVDGLVGVDAHIENDTISAQSLVVITEKGDKGDPGYTPIKGVDYFDGEPGYTPIKGVDYFDGEPGYTPVKGIDYFDGKDGAPFTYDMFTPAQLEALKGEPGYTPIKGKDYFDGYTPIKGKDYFDGYTPVKNVDYFDGKDGTPGKDGKTPVKGVDYFDGYTPRKGVDYFDGEPGYTPQKGVDYFDGEPGYTPIKGVDYFDGAKGDTPVITSTKEGKVTTVYSDGVEIATINDGEDGAGAVTDVQVAGKSILSNGVANIQLHTGLKTNANNVIYLPDPNAAQINGRAYNVALTLVSLDNGVKAAMCDGKGPDWSDDEKAAARARMGINDVIFFAEYRVTPFADIKAAYDDGKAVFLIIDEGYGQSNIFMLSNLMIGSESSYAEFNSAATDITGESIFAASIIVTNTDYWQESFAELSQVTDDHINGLIDAKLGVIENGAY